MTIYIYIYISVYIYIYNEFVLAQVFILGVFNNIYIILYLCKLFINRGILAGWTFYYLIYHHQYDK